MKKTNKTGYGDQVRKLFATSAAAMTLADVCTHLGVTHGYDRKRVAWAVRDLVDGGYARQEGTRGHSTYQSTGKPQPVIPKRTEEEKRQQTRQASRRYRSRHLEQCREAERTRRALSSKNRPAAQQPRLARVGLMAANLPAKRATPVARAETIEEFQARGGRIERLRGFAEAA